MKRIHKIVSVILLLSVVFSFLTVSSYASSIVDLALAVKDGETDKGTIPAQNFYVTLCDYSIKVNESGTFKLKYSASCNSLTFCLYNSNGNSVLSSDYDIEAGSRNTFQVSNDKLKVSANSLSMKEKGSVSYPVEKGTYYLRIEAERQTNFGTGKYTFKFSYPGEKKTKISYLSLDVKKGESIKLDGVFASGKSKIKWSSNKKSVATVDSTGKITGRSKGSAIITAKSASSSIKIKINVK